jgi:hypothetical protein
MTSETIDDDLDAQESVVLVFDLQQAKSSRHQGRFMRFQRFCTRQALQECKQRIPETLSTQKKFRSMQNQESTRSPYLLWWFPEKDDWWPGLEKHRCDRWNQSIEEDSESSGFSRCIGIVS